MKEVAPIPKDLEEKIAKEIKDGEEGTEEFQAEIRKAQPTLTSPT